MRISKWSDYELIDTSDGERLERWGNIILIRPDPQVIWKSSKKNAFWKNANAVYHRSKTGGGQWQKLKNLPESWQIKYKNLKFNIKLMGFKHTGVFPEQATNWDFIIKKIKNSKKTLKILNLFGYTGGATLAAASGGAHVCHVDASKGMVNLAKENFLLSNLSKNSVRWIVDDCVKFVKREIRRGNKYDGIIMDPPAYGRGPDGEIWKIESDLFLFLRLCVNLLSDDAQFLILNSYTSGLAPSNMKNILNLVLNKSFKGIITADEIGLPVTDQNIVLSCGSTAIWQNMN